MYTEDEEIERLSNRISALEGRVLFLRKSLVDLMYEYRDEKGLENEVGRILDADDELEADM
jgi:hypothetical protein